MFCFYLLNLPVCLLAVPANNKQLRASGFERNFPGQGKDYPDQ